jgi:hypothetical protein
MVLGRQHQRKNHLTANDSATITLPKSSSITLVNQSVTSQVDAFLQGGGIGFPSRQLQKKAGGATPAGVLTDVITSCRQIRQCERRRPAACRLL